MISDMEEDSMNNNDLLSPDTASQKFYLPGFLTNDA